jgi:23S rRNA U2552 (ribose-2'-O)-methylase RlmE/FtsJ
MLATPIVLDPATVTIHEEALVSDKAEIGDIDAALERSKEQVGIFKIRHGDAMWKNRVAHVDRKVHLDGATTTPVSRAYYKLMEIIRTCAIRVNKRSLHLCEAPGGFAQATMDDTNAREILVTSRKCDGAPHFSPLILRSDRIDFMKDLPHFADLTMRAVRDEIVRLAQGSEFITADGAIDNDAQPEIAEAMTATLICHEVDTALRAQAVGGTFVLKIFSMALPITKQCIAILTRCYETVSIIKPFTSRAVNDERYVVCQNFIGPISLPTIPDRTPTRSNSLRSHMYIAKCIGFASHTSPKTAWTKGRSRWTLSPERPRTLVDPTVRARQ